MLSLKNLPPVEQLPCVEIRKFVTLKECMHLSLYVTIYNELRYLQWLRNKYMKHDAIYIANLIATTLKTLQIILAGIALKDRVHLISTKLALEVVSKKCKHYILYTSG